MEFANTPDPSYYAVIFTSIQNENLDNYQVVSKRMLSLAKNQLGF
jgi:hypothetical protein